jgi:hypothetical protein
LACQQAFAKRDQTKATVTQAEGQLRVADLQLRANLESIGQGFVATCRDIDTPPVTASVVSSAPIPPPAAVADMPPAPAPATRHDFTADGVSLSATVPSGATPSSRSTGKGTMHAEVTWPSLPNDPYVDITDWQGEKCSYDSELVKTLPAGTRVERNQYESGERSVLYYANPDGTYSASVCNSPVGYHCGFNSLSASIAPTALDVCLSVERVGAMQPPLSDDSNARSADATATCTVAALACGQFSTHGQVGKKLHAAVFAAEQAGRHAEAICLAQPNQNSADKWLAGAASFEASRAWDALGCHDQAVAAIETSLAVRPHDQGGWKETCEQCAKIGGTCAPCNQAAASTGPMTRPEPIAVATPDGTPSSTAPATRPDAGSAPVDPYAAPAGSSDCTQTIADPKSTACRAQYCASHKDDPKCGLE